VPDPDEFPGKTLLLSTKEETQLDDLFGMAWGGLLGTLIGEKYAGDVDGAELRSFGATSTFLDPDNFLLTFT
jgi:hypothetical protein